MKAITKALVLSVGLLAGTAHAATATLGAAGTENYVQRVLNAKL